MNDNPVDIKDYCQMQDLVRICAERDAEIKRLKAEIKWLYDQIAAQKRTAGEAAVAALEPK